MKSLNKIICIALLIVIVVNGCKKDSNSTNYNAIDKKGNVLVNDNKQSLNSRVKKTNQILQVQNVEFSSTKGQGIPQKIDLTQNFVFKLRAEVDAPVYEGNTLQATHVRIIDHYAFVTYNTQGSKYLGGLDVFDVTDISNPTIVWNAVFKNADVSSVDYYNNKLYLVGAFDIDADAPSYLKSPAVLEVLSLQPDRSIAKVDTIIDLNAYVGTDIRVNAQSIYTTSGSNGYLKVFNHNYKVVDSVKLDHARSVDANNGKIYVLQGQPGRLNVYNQSDASFVTTFAVGDANQEEAQSGVVASNKYLFAALNEGGVQILNLDGSLKQVVPRPLIPEGENPENFVSNSVSIYNDLALIANGEAGLYVGGLISSRNDSLAIMGKIAFSDGASTNFVTANDSVIFVATGRGGLKILSVSIDEGLPPVIIPTTPCPGLIFELSVLLPAGVDNMTTNPDLFSSSANKKIILTKESEVYITFISEGAYWKNSIGFYTYDINNPPTSVDALQKTILFPNASETGSGGNLTTGDMVKVGTGKFKAGTVIGFYLVAEGWKNGLVTDGQYTIYTDMNLNYNNNQQHLLFKDRNCGDIVLTFEDINIIYSDHDLNDVIFTISDNKDQKAITAFDLNNMVVK